MADHVCPPILGYLLINPLRRLIENPEKMLGPFVTPGMTVLEPGPGMGFFTLPMARMAGPDGKIVVVDIQERMLAKLRRRAAKAGLAERIDARLISGESMGVGDMAGLVDLATAIHVVHELPDQGAFFNEVFDVLKPGGRLLIIEPKGHVKEKDFERSILLALGAGFAKDDQAGEIGGRSAVLAKPKGGES
jgi:ubiquinone/menaquinone biosynthesis C-methylase UbiE